MSKCVIASQRKPTSAALGLGVSRGGLGGGVSVAGVSVHAGGAGVGASQGGGSGSGSGIGGAFGGGGLAGSSAANATMTFDQMQQVSVITDREAELRSEKDKATADITRVDGKRNHLLAQSAQLEAKKVPSPFS